MVVRDGQSLSVGQGRDRGPQGVVLVGHHRGDVRNGVGGHGPASCRAMNVDGLAVRDGHQPGLHVRVLGQIGVRPECGEEGLRPRVVGVDGTDHGATDPQHHGAVGGHDGLERKHHDQ